MSRFDLSGRIGLVTGGGTGIGRGIAAALADAGATLIIAGRRQDVAANAAADLSRAQAMALDVTDRAAIDRTVASIVAQHGRLDILVTSAGTNRRLPTLEYDEASWDAVIDTNLKGAFFCAQSAARMMKPNGWGRIIHVGSVAATLASSLQTGYCSSKAGLVQLNKVMAIELAPFGITCNTISPGPFRTPLSERLFNDPHWVATVVNRVPMGRVGAADDLAGIAVFLASDAAAFITGQNVNVDGGLSTGV
jgi:NAD(P)-dependent dehydrogenase (short-subunit alcohol dehydrogenase family)